MHDYSEPTIFMQTTYARKFSRKTNKISSLLIMYLTIRISRRAILRIFRQNMQMHQILVQICQVLASTNAEQTLMPGLDEFARNIAQYAQSLDLFMSVKEQALTNIDQALASAGSIKIKILNIGLFARSSTYWLPPIYKMLLTSLMKKFFKAPN